MVARANLFRRKTMLLTTVVHEKLPKGWSHPLPTEKLSHALEGIPQFSDIRVSFLGAEGQPLGPSIEGTPVHGAAASSLGGYKELLLCKWEKDQWTISLHAVPSDRKASAQGECLQHALPELRAWFQKSRPESWFIGRHCIQIGLSEVSHELALRETHNDRIVTCKEFLEGSSIAS